LECHKAGKKVRCTGYLVIVKHERYKLHFCSKLKVKLNDKECKSAQEQELQEGPHKFEAEFNEEDDVQLEYSTPTLPRTLVPEQYLQH
jgi:hypothetical protein